MSPDRFLAFLAQRLCCTQAEARAVVSVCGLIEERREDREFWMGLGVLVARRYHGKLEDLARAATQELKWAGLGEANEVRALPVTLQSWPTYLRELERTWAEDQAKTQPGYQPPEW